MKALAAAGLAVLLAASGAMAAPVWDWQLTAPFKLDRDVEWLDLDPDNHSVTELAKAKLGGAKLICYVSVGTLEDWRDDVGAFPASVVGKTYGDWPDEKFLDIRALDVLLPLMTARFEKCRAFGFDAIEPDNMDVHDNESGFDLAPSDTIVYVRQLARIAHDMGLLIGQKNVPDLTAQLVGSLDFMVAESCHQDGWCQDLALYQTAEKPIFDAEYNDRPLDLDAACAQARQLHISLIVKDRDLTASLQTCP